jgi:hypothetical protein
MCVTEALHIIVHRFAGDSALVSQWLYHVLAILHHKDWRIPRLKPKTSSLTTTSTGLTLGRHPRSLLRPALLEQRLMPATTLMSYPNGRFARRCGLVTGRQRPGSAKGVMF